MVGGIPDEFPEGIARGFARGGCPRHAMGLIHDGQVPMHLAEAGEDLVTLGKIERRDDLFVLQPLIRPKLVTDIGSLEYQEGLIKLVFELPLPLKGQIRWADDEEAFHQAPELQLTD